MPGQLDHSPPAHYDRVTEAWRLLLGEELHYGVYATGTEPLADATAALTDLMLSHAGLAPGLSVLDVGCGTGYQACRLHRHHGVQVLGITTSAIGVEIASGRAAEQGCADDVRFELRDGMDNQLPVDSFDRVWVLESSHLMSDRAALIQECARVLKPGGRLVLCDVIRRREIPFAELRRRTAEFAALRAAFGEARMDTLDDYAALLTDAGLEVTASRDITAETKPTFAAWLANAATHRVEVLTHLSEEELETFESATKILDALWDEGTLGYGIIAARSISTTEV